MTHRLPDSGTVDKVASGLAKVVDAVTVLLPGPVANKVRESRKVVVTAAGSVLTVLTALQTIPWPEDASHYLAFAFVAATAVVTWWTPNAESA